MKRNRLSSLALALLLAVTLLLPCMSASADYYDVYVVESFSPNGYCYLYSSPQFNRAEFGTV